MFYSQQLYYCFKLLLNNYQLLHTSYTKITSFMVKRKPSYTVFNNGHIQVKQMTIF